MFLESQVFGVPESVGEEYRGLHLGEARQAGRRIGEVRGEAERVAETELAEAEDSNNRDLLPSP